jgi:uncharacterized membrane protein YvbJ
MFCPQCGSENNIEKKYCRQCGFSLSAVRLALDGRTDEAIKTIAGDEKRWQYRLRIGVAGVLILIAIVTIVAGGKIGFSNIQSAALILIIMMIFFIQLARKSHRVARLLDADDQSVALNLSDSRTTRSQLESGSSVEGISSQSSITEQSTLELKPDDRMRHQR